MTDDEIRNIFLNLFDDSGPSDLESVPLLAHYTNAEVLESILKNEEIWLANPLYMNDQQEIRFGVIEGRDKVLASIEIKKAFSSAALYKTFTASFEYAYKSFADEQALDVFVLCFSAHRKNDYDGRLSMWRGYGGNASGACIVFDPKKVPEAEGVPFIFSSVVYASTVDRFLWIDKLIQRFCDLLVGTSLTETVALHAGHYLFERLKLFSLFNKHIGFFEEEEWRLVYRLDMDTSGKYKEMIDYKVGARGLEPKLKLKLRALTDFGSDGIIIENLIDRIILGGVDKVDSQIT
ncbi:MAG: DUF2971 domain-containing protein [Aestuariivirga sp.]|uniref:DUF2971 domain-containing protein n=1 Tax=Aestuariivirga sp. TaxID=2650926 RepID=UPI0038CF81BC